MTWLVFKKEMIDALRDRKTLFFSVMIPILFNVLLVLYFDRVLLADKQETYTIAVQETTNEQVLGWINELPNITVLKTNSPIEEVKAGKAQLAMEVDSSFTEKLNQYQTPAITLYADTSSQKGSAISNQIITQLEKKKQQFVQERLVNKGTDPNILQPFVFSEKSINQKDAFSLYMITIFSQLILILSIFMGQISVANDMFAGEKERKTMEALILTPVNRIHIITGKWLAISSLGLISGIFSLVSFITVVTLFTNKLSKALNMSDNVLLFTFALLVGIVSFSLLTATVLMILSLLANTMKEGQNYIAPVTTCMMIPYFFLIGLSPNELNTTYFLIPFMNIFALIKQIMYSIYNPINIACVAGSSILFILICFSIAYGMFQKSKWVLGKS